MKQLILTGLATEQSFAAAGEAQYFLVFNKGELRVPITEEAALIVVNEMMAESHLPDVADQDAYNDLPEDGSYPTSYNQDSEESTPDSDGVDQI